MSRLLLQFHPLTVSINSNYADDTHMFVVLSLSFLSSSLYSLQRCVSSHHSWFIHNGLILNPTKTEAICFGTSTRLQSLSHLTSIEIAGTTVSLVDYVKLLGVTFDKHLKDPFLVLYSLSYTPLISVLSYLILQQTTNSMLMILNFS